MADKENIDIDFDTATIPILKDFLRDRGFPVSGNKKKLIERSKGVITLGKKPLSVLRENDLREKNSRELSRFRTPLGESLPRPEALCDGWTENVHDFPNFTNNELYNYLVLSKERTCDGASNKASRQLKAKVFYEDRHVHSVQYHHINTEISHCYIRSKVIPSLPTPGKKDYDVWTCLSKVTGRVHSAGCNCNAGEGESCNHVAALLYALEDISHKRSEGLDACTSGHNKWKEPR
ncbi:uncharacterized protein LOC132745041 [Ruditapes philippinarum]|uniref:uncharacterized protein LOC132745041 n=1 Tax=Ruditapes philippinarum TaxID=129788 RepID=UPI00295B3029|nr:uncharacterized protein LOC132745041 [Ruditapes philippinarum]